MQDQVFKRQQTLFNASILIEALTVGSTITIVSILDNLYPLIFTTPIAVLVGYFGIWRTNDKMKEISGEKEIKKKEEKGDINLKDEIFELMEEFHKLCDPTDKCSIYNFINKLNLELRDKRKNIFSEEYTTSSIQETASRYKNLEARYEDLSKEKIQVVLFLDEFTSLIECYYLFVKNVEQFVENNRIEITSNLKKQYREKFRDKYNEFFVEYKGFAKRIYNIYEEKKNIPNLKAPHIT